MLAAVFELARPLLFALDPEQAHELTLKSLEAGHLSAQRRRPTTSGWRSSAVGPDVSQSARHRRGLRQGRARAASRARHGPRLRRDRHRHARCRRQGNPRPRVFRLVARPRADQPARIQQRRPRRGAGAARSAAGRTASSASTSAPTRTRPTAPPTTSRASAASTTWRATSRSTSPRPTRRACATCRRPPRSTSCWPACWRRARELVAAGKPQPPDRRQARARHRRGRSRARSSSVLSRRGVDGIAIGNTTLSRARRGDAAARTGGRRPLGPAAVPPLDRHAGARAIA